MVAPRLSGPVGHARSDCAFVCGARNRLLTPGGRGLHPSYLLSAVAVLLASYVALPRRMHGVLRYLGLMTYSYYLIHTLSAYVLGAFYRRLVSTSEAPVWVRIGFGLLALPLSFLFVRWIELPTLRIRGELLKAGSPAVRYAPWLAWGSASSASSG